MGLSAGFFAGYVVAVQITVMLVFAGVSAVIFWRGPNDVMAIYTSFTLLIFGGAAFTNEVPGALTEAHPSFWLPLAVLYYVGQVSFFAFFYIFPEQLSENLVSVVEKTVQPERVSLWLREPDRGERR